MTVKKEPTTVQAAGFFLRLHAGSSGGSKTCPRRRARPPADLPRRCPGQVPATLAAFPGVVPAEIPPGGNPGVVPEVFRLRAARPLLFPILSRCSPAVRRAPTRFPGCRHESPLIRRDPPEVPTPAPLLSKGAKPGGRRYGGRRKGFSVPSAALSRPFRRDSAPPSARHLRKPERHVSVLPCSCRRKKPSAGDLFRTDPRRCAPPHACRMPGGPTLRPFPALFQTKKSPTFRKGTSGVVGQFSDLTADAHADPRRRYGAVGKGAASLLRLFRGRFRRDPLLPLHGTFGSLKGTSLSFPASAAGKSILLRATFSAPLPGATPPHAYRMPGGPALRPFPALFRTKKARHSVRNIGRRRSIFRSYSRCARRSAPSRGESSAGAMSNTVFAPVSPF